jgi:hypothetical protein
MLFKDLCAYYRYYFTAMLLIREVFSEDGLVASRQLRTGAFNLELFCCALHIFGFVCVGNDIIKMWWLSGASTVDQEKKQKS